MPSHTTSTTVFVSDLKLNARIGIYAHEQTIEQPLTLDINVRLNHRTPFTLTTTIDHTADYETIASIARSVVEADHYPLVESLAHEIARALFELPHVERCTVRVAKLGCLKQATAGGVEVTQSRDANDMSKVQRPSPRPLEALHAHYPVAILGGGVAGLSAALWCQRLNVPCLIVEKNAMLGGQLHWIHRPIEDLPGSPFVTGSEWLERITRQLDRAEEIWCRGTIVAVEPRDRQIAIMVASASDATTSNDTKTITASAVIVALGLRRRTLDVPGETEFYRRGILPTGAKEIDHLRHQTVAVVGGGDAACKNALHLASVGAHVHLIHRRNRLSCRDEFRRRILHHPSVTVHYETVVEAFFGKTSLTHLVIGTRGRRTTLPVSAALVRVGWVPNTDPLPTSWIDTLGIIEPEQLKRHPGVFIAGDLASSYCHSVSHAMGSGSCAAKAAARYLENRNIDSTVS